MGRRAEIERVADAADPTTELGCANRVQTAMVVRDAV